MPSLTELETMARERLAELEPAVAEAAELQRILAAMAPGTHGKPSAKPKAKPKSKTKRGRPTGRATGARAKEALRLVAGHPGISVGEMAGAMGIGKTYLYRVLPRMEREGLIAKKNGGYVLKTEGGIE